jgi:hypothetical protein
MIAILRALLQACVLQFTGFSTNSVLRLSAGNLQCASHIKYRWYLKDVMAMIESGDYRFPIWLKWCHHMMQFLARNLSTVVDSCDYHIG